MSTSSSSDVVVAVPSDAASSIDVADAPIWSSSDASAADDTVDAAPRPSRSLFYSRLLSKVRLQLSSSPSRDPIAICANIAALLYHSYHTEFGLTTSVNWSGFYFVRNVIVDNTESSPSLPPSQVLILGPFHGQPAVSLIQFGKGVCGTSVVERATQVVPDVHLHPNHIACDSASSSEIVVPVFANRVDDAGERVMIGLIDIDSPTVSFFDDDDRVPLETVAELISAKCDWSILESSTLHVTLPDSDTCPMSAH